ncbi:MAG: alpha/beta hydrolase [Ignavibacteriales bacterium]|nr:alpha/beta hydrolase [Ignavibacteriales bacterium]
MKKIFVIVILSLVTFSGCSGYLYTDKPALEFENIDYGYPVKKSLSNPSIAYIDAGTGEQTLILVHGLASNAGFWRYVIPELAKKYRVIAVDLPGYGKSSKEPYDFKLSFYAEQIKRLADDLNLKKFTYVGHSMGGQIGLIFSMKYPDRLNKLVLAAPAGFEEFERGEGDWLRSVLTINAVKKTTEEGIRRNLSGNFYSWDDKWECMVEERVRMAKAVDFEDFCYTVTRCVGAMLDEPTFNKLKKVKTPTLVIYGKYDGLIPNPYLNPGFTADVFKSGAAQMPDCRLVEIDDCGHMLQIEKPEEFLNAVNGFLQ